MKATIIIRPYNTDEIKLPEYEIILEGQPEEIVPPFNSILDKVGSHPTIIKTSK